MADYLKFDLSGVTDTVEMMSDNIKAFLNGDAALADSLITHYRGLQKYQCSGLALQHPEYVGVKNGLEGLWLFHVTSELATAGHSMWVYHKVFEALSAED